MLDRDVFTRVDPAEIGEKEDSDAPFTSAEWQRIAVILIVALFSIVFWMGFEQAGVDQTWIDGELAFDRSGAG